MQNNASFAGNRASKKTIRFDIRQGHLSQYMGPEKPRREFDYAEGQLEGISIRAHETAGGEINFMDCHFVNGDTKFVISSIASSGVSADIIAHLANLKNPKSTVRVEVWLKGPYTNCSVMENGEKLPFLSLPKAVKVPNGLKMIVDSTDRDTAVLKLIEELNSRLGYEAK